MCVRIIYIYIHTYAYACVSIYIIRVCVCVRYGLWALVSIAANHAVVTAARTILVR